MRRFRWRQKPDYETVDRLVASLVISGNVATPEAVIDLENWGGVRLMDIKKVN